MSHLARLVACFAQRPSDGGGWLSLRGRGKGVRDGYDDRRTGERVQATGGLR